MAKSTTRFSCSERVNSRFSVYCKNARLHTEDRLAELLGELNQCQWDVVLFSETRRNSDHCKLAAACPRSGVLRARGGPLERAAARVCREAGATVALNVRLRDLNVDVARQDERCIEVIANGLALWGGSQLAVDTRGGFIMHRAAFLCIAQRLLAETGFKPVCMFYSI